MTTQEIATRLIAYCRAQDWTGAHRELYAADIVSVEPLESPGLAKETKGLSGVLEKGRRFDETVESMHSMTVSAPIVAGRSFACIMSMDVTMKGQGRMQMSELCVYEVKDGKIVREEFHL